MCTGKQLLFAMLYVELGNACEAYRQSYITSNITERTAQTEAYRLTVNPAVQKKISELREMHVERHKVTVDQIALGLDQAIDQAMNFGRTAAAVSALLGKAKLYGLMVDQAHVTGNLQSSGPPVIIFTDRKSDESDKITLEG